MAMQIARYLTSRDLYEHYDMNCGHSRSGGSKQKLPGRASKWPKKGQFHKRVIMGSVLIYDVSIRVDRMRRSLYLQSKSVKLLGRFASRAASGFTAY